MGAHSRTIDEVLEQFQVDKGGLTTAEARRRLAAEGPNRPPDARRDSLIYVLLVAVVITALLQHWIDSGVILGVVVTNAVIGLIQAGKAEAALEGIRKMLSLDAQVHRHDHWGTIDAQELVPGDAVSCARVGGYHRISVTANPHASAFYSAVGFLAGDRVTTALGEGTRMYIEVERAQA